MVSVLNLPGLDLGVDLLAPMLSSFQNTEVTSQKAWKGEAVKGPTVISM